MCIERKKLKSFLNKGVAAVFAILILFAISGLSVNLSLSQATSQTIAKELANVIITVSSIILGFSLLSFSDRFSTSKNSRKLNAEIIKYKLDIIGQFIIVIVSSLFLIIFSDLPDNTFSYQGILIPRALPLVVSYFYVFGFLFIGFVTIFRLIKTVRKNLDISKAK